TLLNVAEKLYDSPVYQTSCFFIDTKGNKKPNPYKDRSKWNEYLNFMTIRRFNRLLKELPFEVRHQEQIGFGGSTFKLSRMVRGLANVPVLNEFFTSVLFTVLVKPETRKDRAVSSGSSFSNSETHPKNQIFLALA
ncbi:MAG TPA: hypothetical protein VFS77_16610, partial [Pyrinomonadaceae bacterium]|nr:hypothetical protein [Pyrinomonadaceae bacterium]